jgi:Tol biopolymer transport system component
MNKRNIFLSLFIPFLVVFVFAFQTSDDLKILYEKAKYTMETKGDLQEALTIFEQIVVNTNADRSLRAKAQLHIGICWEKMGKDEAQQAYKQVIQEFADQQEMVSEAHARLAVLVANDSGSGFTATGEKNKGVIFRQIDFDGLDRTHCARLSPDGNKMIYVRVWDKKPTYSICVRDLISGQDHLLVEGVGESNYFEWSPDGRKIVYTYKDRELRVISSDGGEPEVLWNFTDQRSRIFPLDWSRNGDHILVGVMGLADWTIRLAILPATGDELRYIVSGVIRQLGAFAHFSPDGKFIVGEQTKEHNTDIYVWVVDSGQELRVTDHPAKDDNPVWSSDGKYIVFTSDRANTEDLWAVPILRGIPTGAPLRIKRNLGKNTHLTSLTPNGQLMMLVIGEGIMSDLFVVSVDPSTGEATGKFVPFAKYPTEHFLPRWSPDGKRVAYTSRKGNISLPGIFISSGSEMEDKEVPIRDYYACNIEWSRDGEHLIFPGISPDGQAGIFRASLKDNEIVPLYLEDSLGQDYIGAFINLMWLPQAGIFMFGQLAEAGKRKIYTMDSEGNNVQLVADKVPAIYWTWPSPDARYVAYREGQELKLWSLSESTSMTLAKYPDGKEVEGPVWSPDGANVTWKDKQQLKLLSITKGTIKTLVKTEERLEIGGSAWYGGLAWSPDGKNIAYILRDVTAGSKARAELWSIPAVGGTPLKITVAPESHPMLRDLIWHPGGKLIVATGQGAGRGYEYWVIENFLPE